MLVLSQISMVEFAVVVAVPCIIYFIFDDCQLSVDDVSELTI